MAASRPRREREGAEPRGFAPFAFLRGAIRATAFAPIYAAARAATSTAFPKATRS